MDRLLDAKSNDLQREINRLSQVLGVRPMPVGFRTNDDLNIFIDDKGSYHFTYYERGKLGFDRAGSLDDLCTGIAKVWLVVKLLNGSVTEQSDSGTNTKC